MVQSINTKVDLVIKGTSYLGLCSYGQIMIGDRGFEFYNDRNVKDYIQIPWESIDYVSASVVMKNKISRFAIFTTDKSHLTFSSRDNKKVLRTMNQYIPSDKLVRSLDFKDVVTRGAKSIPSSIKTIFKK